jgi:Temperature dependent protein affecting M2 dsRNA replication
MDSDRTEVRRPPPSLCYGYPNDGARLPFGTELNTTFALLVRCKLEDSVLKLRRATVPVEAEMSLVEVADWTSLCPLAPQEIKRMFAFWDAVLSLVPPVSEME